MTSGLNRQTIRTPPFEDDAEPSDYPFEAGDWRSGERETLLERRYE